jgi:hypothetical protein
MAIHNALEKLKQRAWSRLFVWGTPIDRVRLGSDYQEAQHQQTITGNTFH